MNLSPAKVQIAVVHVRGKKIRCCPECGSKALVEDSDAGELACTQCGLIVNDRLMNRGRDWRAYTREESNAKAHMGPPTTVTRHDKNLPTFIGYAGQHLSPEKFRQVQLLRKWQVRTRCGSATERNLSRAMSEIDRLTDVLHIPYAVKERAASLYRALLDKNLVRGRSIDHMSTAALYAACRLSGNPRTLKEFTQCAIHASKKDLARSYRVIVNELNVKMPVWNPITCIAKIATKVGISMQSQQRAAAILTQLQGNPVLRAKDPSGLAGAALYVACILEGEKATQRDIAAASGMTEVSIRNRYASIVGALGLEKGPTHSSSCRLRVSEPAITSVSSMD